MPGDEEAKNPLTEFLQEATGVNEEPLKVVNIPSPTVERDRDRLAEAFMKQNMLQVMIYGPRYRADMGEREKEALAIVYLLGLHGEGAEAMRRVRIDPAWSKLEAPDMAGLRGEVVDAFHYIVNLGLLLWGGDSEAFFADYAEKWKANLNRATVKAGDKSLLPDAPARFRHG